MAYKQRTHAALDRRPASRPIAAGIALTFGLLVVAGCVGAGSSIAARPTQASPATTSPVPSQAGATAGVLVVTAADDGTVLHLAVGQQFLLNLGPAMDWTVTVADQQIVQRVIGVLVIRGAQGIYEARTAGSTSLSAVGSPPCASGICPLYRLGFRVTITVS